MDKQAALLPSTATFIMVNRVKFSIESWLQILQVIVKAIGQMIICIESKVRQKKAVSIGDMNALIWEIQHPLLSTLAHYKNQEFMTQLG